MFAFYYGIMADLSPPVALAALAAAPIAKENPDKIGWEAMRIALAGYVIPFIFVYSPALMLQAGDPMAAELGFYGAVAFATFKALVAIGLFGMVAIGFLFTRLTLARARRRFRCRALPARRFPLQRHHWLYARRRACRALAMAAAPAPRGGGGLSLCLTSAGVVKTLSLAAFTLAWTHSIEKIDWQEDWRVTPQGLELVQARVKGSGAGMEPPPEARLVDGWFQWQPKRAPMPEVVLGNSGAAGEWRLCHDGSCRTLSEIFGHPIGANVTTMRGCEPQRGVSRGEVDATAQGQDSDGGRRRLDRAGLGQWQGDRRDLCARGRAGVLRRSQRRCRGRNRLASSLREGGKATAFTADVSRAADVEAMVAACLEAYGRIDVLDNNVGIAEIGSVVEVSEAEWDRVFAVNLKSAFLSMKHVIPVMQRQGGGSIINISSIASIRHLGISYVTYAATKAAMNQMTRTTAVQYAPDHIRVNAILPGLMKTPMVEHSAGLAASYARGDVEAMWRARDAQVPMGHMGDAWDVANAALFLASDESKYVTGIELVVDGGITCKVG